METESALDKMNEHVNCSHANSDFEW